MSLGQIFTASHSLIWRTMASLGYANRRRGKSRSTPPAVISRIMRNWLLLVRSSRAAIGEAAREVRVFERAVMWPRARRRRHRKCCVYLAGETWWRNAEARPRKVIAELITEAGRRHDDVDSELQYASQLSGRARPPSAYSSPSRLYRSDRWVTVASDARDFGGFPCERK